jgi:hypothetical protein
MLIVLFQAQIQKGALYKLKLLPNMNSLKSLNMRMSHDYFFMDEKCDSG